ncbi:hypothetical protein FLAG1_04676 [Fusarium langsethiae]|uniref:Uncharacterized protein n=1 Tax=Fusarium langsethiae TaxID=179993 RepID=A0A0N0V780_FUSLA|nr:hypothetical protein FLAG1_04676 [Fusarium langsethiae]GKT98141.1 unnamed protein product [Fusarium langsethiae]GKU18119.1 unnamed protein product [Fusarium langsethiae]
MFDNNMTFPGPARFPFENPLSISEFSAFKRSVLHFVVICITLVTAVANTILVAVVYRKTYYPNTVFKAPEGKLSEPVKVYTAALNRNIFILVGLQICFLLSSSTIRSIKGKGVAINHAFLCYSVIFATMVTQAWNLWRIYKKFEPPKDEAIELVNYPPADAQGCEQEQDADPVPPYAAFFRRPA